MDTTSSTVAAVIIVVVGQWAKDKENSVSIKLVVGMMVLVLMLSMLSSANEKFAQQLSALILVGAVFTYAMPIVKKLGLTKK